MTNEIKWFSTLTSCLKSYLIKLIIYAVLGLGIFVVITLLNLVLDFGEKKELYWKSRISSINMQSHAPTFLFKPIINIRMGTRKKSYVLDGTCSSVRTFWLRSTSSGTPKSRNDTLNRSSTTNDLPHCKSMGSEKIEGDQGSQKTAEIKFYHPSRKKLNKIKIRWKWKQKCKNKKLQGNNGSRTNENELEEKTSENNRRRIINGKKNIKKKEDTKQKNYQFIGEARITNPLSQPRACYSF